MVFAEIVSLIAAFSTERALGRIEKNQDFLAWLEANNHEELRGLLERNGQAMAGIQALLNENQDALLTRLIDIDGILAKLLSRIEGFGAIALSVNAEAILSEQAIDILRQCDEHRAGRFVQVDKDDPTGCIFLGNAQGKLTCTDASFINDDLATLVDLGLLRQREYNSEGDPIYTFTREGSRLVRMIDHKNQNDTADS